MLEHEWSPGFHRPIPCGDRFQAVVRMDGVAGLPILQLLERPSEVIQDAMIDELERAVGGMDRHEAGDGVHDQPKALGAETPSVVAGCEIFRIEHGPELRACSKHIEGHHAALPSAQLQRLSAQGEVSRPHRLRMGSECRRITVFLALRASRPSSADVVSGCDQFAGAGSAHLNGRLSGAPSQGLHEVGGIRESGSSPDLRCGHAIEQRRLKHAHREIDASLDQHRSERVATGP